MIQFTNTLGHRLEQFEPITEGEVRMYTCGPHRLELSTYWKLQDVSLEDFLKRYLKYRGFKVSHVMNLTDVDDGSSKCATSRESISRPSPKNTRMLFSRIWISSGWIGPNRISRATGFIAEMVKSTFQGLLDKQIASPRARMARSALRSQNFSITGDYSGIKTGGAKGRRQGPRGRLW